MPGYSELSIQTKTLAAFHRPVILTDDLLHHGHRLRRIETVFRQEGLEIEAVIVGILSGTGSDLAEARGRRVEAAYRIPNLLHWFNESLLYPYVGGDSVDGAEPGDGALPTINMILPYFFPDYLYDVGVRKIAALSLCALENARDILRALERFHQASFGTPLSIRRMDEAFLLPRLPFRGRHVRSEQDILPSAYLEDDLAAFHRLRGGSGNS